MAESSAWRFECCNQVLNALRDDNNAALAVSTIPLRRKGRSGHSLIVLVTNNGRVLATCRHEVDANNELHWIEQMLRIFALAVNHL